MDTTYPIPANHPDHPVCACRIHESGRGVSPCAYHAKVIEEHQTMWHALDAIATRTAAIGDPGDYAAQARNSVQYRHAR